MMKKLLAILLSAAICVSVTACGAATSDDEDTDKDDISDGDKKDKDDNRDDGDDVAETDGDAENQDVDNNAEDENNDLGEIAYEITYSNVTVYKNSLGLVQAQTIVEITNTGTKPISLKSGSFDLEDLNGGLIASESMVSAYPQILESGEKGFYYEESAVNKLDDIQELVVKMRPDIKEAKESSVKLTLSDLEVFTGTLGRLDCSGRVENTTDEEQGEVYISIVLYDSADNPIGLLFTIVDDLAVGDKVGFEASGLTLPDSVTVESVARIEGIAYPFKWIF